MGYISKQLLKKAYNTLSGLTEDHKQGQTQIVSALRYIVALDMFYKDKKRSCDLGNSSDRDDFISNVKFVVNICDDFYTANFYTTIEEIADCRVGSNFFSQGVVVKSKTNTAITLAYPTRGSFPLFRVKNNNLYYVDSYLANISNYLPNDLLKTAFVIWLLRNENINNLSLKDVQDSLLTNLSSNLILQIIPKEEEFEHFIDGYLLDKNKPSISPADFLQMFETTVEELPQRNNRKEPLQQIFYGAPGTGKSNEIKKKTDGKKVIRTTFHPDSDYSTFVGCYKPTMKEREDDLSIVELTAKLKGMTMAVPPVSYPCLNFATRYWKSLQKLTSKERENIIVACGFGTSYTAEVNKGMAIGEELAGYFKSESIVYRFVKQAFLKAYLGAWKMYADRGAARSMVVPVTSLMPAGSPKSPYARTGKEGSHIEFMYTSRNTVTLDDMEQKMLLDIDNFDFPFDGIDNFGELHPDRITVVVTDKPTDEQKKKYIKIIPFSDKRIRDLADKYINNRNKYGYLEGIIYRIKEELKKESLEELLHYHGEGVKIKVGEHTSMLGMYDPMDKIVYLFMDNIRAEYDTATSLCATYIHEMFHAYYDSGSHYIREIEEPIVECNTLCFLELLDKSLCDSYKRSVRSKKRNPAISYYGLGEKLFENRSLDWMNLYGDAYGRIDGSSSIVRDYRGKFLIFYPMYEEEETMQLLYYILKPGAMATVDKSSGEAEPQFLVIEEINRGNCAQIFGDLFQLLDRCDNGFSEYPIEADTDLQQEIARAFKEDKDYKLTRAINVEGKVKDYTSTREGGTLSKDIQDGHILVLPPNLYIWATMNTSDQSLFPIDSAFKRRWEWKYMPIGYKNDKWTIVIGGKEYKWTEFQRKINNQIFDLDNSEDKMLGDYFVNADRTGNVISADTFLNKILFYLWNDVCKDEPEKIFRWKDGKGVESSIKFSDLFDDDRDTKLQGLMKFLGVPAIGEEPEKTGEPEEAEEDEKEVTSAEEETL